MGNITDTISRTFRDFVTSGIASSGKHEPDKSDIRALGPIVEAQIAAAAIAGGDLVAAAAVINPLADVAGDALTALDEAIASMNDTVEAQIDAAVDAAQSAAAQSAVYAGGFETPEYATQSAGNSATAEGDIFRVPLGTSPQTFEWYRRLAVGSELVDPLATSSALASPTGSELIGRPVGTLSDELDQWVDIFRYADNLTGFRAAVADAMTSGRPLYLHGHRTISGLSSPIVTTAPLEIRADGPALCSLTFTSPTSSLFHVLHDFRCQGFKVSDLTANTSSNGGGFAYNLVADAGATPLKIKVSNMFFDGCKTPLNFEDKFDLCEIECSWFEDGTGHQIRTGATTGFAAWGNWKNSSISHCHFRNITAIAANQSVFCTLQYGKGAKVKHCTTVGVTGAGTGEAHAHYAQAQYFYCLFNRAEGISGGATNRGMTNKGELNSRYSVFIGNHVDGGGTCDCFAWYGGEGFMLANTAVDPLNAGITVGSTSGSSHSQFIGNNVFGTGRANCTAYSIYHDDGKITLKGGSISGFTKAVAINSYTGATELILDLECDNNTGPVEIYTTGKLPKLTVKGTAKITNNSQCLWLRGPGGFGQVVVDMSHLESVGGFGVYYDAAIDDLHHKNAVHAGHGTGREVTFVSATPKRIDLQQTRAFTTTSGAVTKLMEFPLANGQLLDVAVRQSATDGTDNATTRKDWAFKASGGAAGLEGAENISFQRRSAGASTWDVTSTFSTNKGQININGQTGKTVKHVIAVSVIGGGL